MLVLIVFFTVIAILLLTLFILTKLPIFVNFKKVYNFSKTLPGPTLRELIENTKRERILPWLRELRERHGKVFRIWFGKDLMIFFSDPDDIKSILSNNQLLYKSTNYRLLQPWLGNGLLTSGGDEWHRRRKMLTPAFHFKILGAFKKPMEDNCDILIRKLDKYCISGEKFDIYPYITLYALDVICETAMGIKKHAQMNSDSEYVTAVQTMCRILHMQSFSFWKRFPFLFNRTEAGKIRNDALKILHSETERVIEIRRKMLKDENIISVDGDDGKDIGIKKRLAFLDMLLLAQNQGLSITDKQIREEVDTFMFEGHDTTSSAIAFTIYLLSQHSDVQQKVYDEIKNIEIGKESDTMKYLEAVIKETLRLYPSVPVYSRMLKDDLLIDNILIPKGASISILAYMLHRNEKQFPEPDIFRPERFLNEDNNNNLHPFAFVAFSAGPRNCIGQKFAMLELKCTLIKILRNFEILPIENFIPQPLAELVMKSGNGVQVKLKKRL